MNSYSYCSYLCLWVRWSYDIWRGNHYTLTNMLKPIFLDNSSFSEKLFLSDLMYSQHPYHKNNLLHTPLKLLWPVSHTILHSPPIFQPPRDNQTWLPLSFLKTSQHPYSVPRYCRTSQQVDHKKSPQKESEATSTRRGVSHATNSRRG